MAMAKTSIILPAHFRLTEFYRVWAYNPIMVVNNVSTDETVDLCRSCGVRVVTHPYRLGNGAAVKAGARVAQGETLVFMDADGQHDPADILPVNHNVDTKFS